MNEPMLESVVQRLSRLERENRWWKLLGLGALTLLGLVILLGGARDTKVADEVLARRFTVVDLDGKPRAALLTEDNGTVRLELHDKDKKIGAALLMTPEVPPRLSFHKDGVVLAWLGLSVAGPPRLDFYSGRGKPRVSLALSPDGMSQLALKGEDMNDGVMVAADSNGEPHLGFYKGLKPIWSVP